MYDRYLFRGKTEIRERWIIGDLMQWDDGTMQIAANDDDGGKSKYTVIPETVGQCTGLKDKNGKLIYEGDILIFTDEDGEKTPYAVHWSEEYAGYIIAEDSEAFTAIDRWDEFAEYFEIVGNIHDNGELMEVEQ